MKITDISIRRPVTITMVMVTILVVGLFALVQLPLELFPSLNLPVASVSVSWSGASPSEVEQQITNPIEQALQSLSGVSEIDSTSSQNVSQVIVQFNYGTDINQEVNQMRSIVNRVQPELPSDASAPVVQQFNPTNKAIMTLSLSGSQSLSGLTELANNVISPAISRLNGVGSVTVVGGLTSQVNVVVSPNQLNFYHLSITQVVQALQDNNVSTDAGLVNKGSLQIPLHIQGQYTDVNQIDKVPVPLPTGGSIPLSDVAAVTNGYATQSLISSLNGQPAVSFNVVQATNANTVQVSQEVRQGIRGLSSQLPTGVKLQILSDSADTIQGTIQTVATHTLLGFVFGVLIMLLILRSIRTTVVIAVAIPIAVMATFMLMYLGGISINSMTLGSLAVGLGSLVDFSIVVLESIFRARQRGLSALAAASEGTREVGLAVVVAAMAQISVFAPAIFTPGIAGQFFRPIALTVSFSHIAALFVAVTLTPMLASRMLRGSRFERVETIPGRDAPFRAWAPFDWFGRGMFELNRFYRTILTWALRRRATVVVVFSLMLIASFALVPYIGFQLIPSINNNQINIGLTLANGTNLVTTTQTANRVAELAKEHMPDVQSVFMQVGSTSSTSFGATNQASLTVTLGPSVHTSMIQLSHEFSHYVADIPGAQVNVSPSTASEGPVSGGETVDIQGPDMQTLSLLAGQVTQIMEQTPGLEYVNNTLVTGTPEYELTVHQEALSQYGMTAQQVETALRDAFQGANASTFYQANTQSNIVVQFPTSFSQNIENLSQVMIPTNQGNLVPLSNLVTLSATQGPPSVDHTNGVRTIGVVADIYSGSQGQIQRQLQQKISHLRVPQGYSINFGQQGSFIGSAFLDLGIALAFSILLIYMVMAGLFESFLTPFVIMFSLPPTFIGGALGLFLTHRSLDLDSMIGIIMVIGLVANNAIVLVDYTNQLRRDGRSLTEALVTAGPIRLRPILMSTLTTVLAMLPLVLGFGEGANTLAAMATVIAFGLLFSTMVTLLLVPVMYVIFDNWIERIKKLFVRNRSIPVTPSSGAEL
ncbi:efflux RND transporter permease subunit [Alicyclobacillaceae bacterium I2511]|nr:efflux RND transporter permease subunit [Alicyclobacillaceae bacterium I2511]